MFSGNGRQFRMTNGGQGGMAGGRPGRAAGTLATVRRWDFVCVLSMGWHCSDLGEGIRAGCTGETKAQQEGQLGAEGLVPGGSDKVDGG